MARWISVSSIYVRLVTWEPSASMSVQLLIGGRGQTRLGRDIHLRRTKGPLRERC